MSVKLPGPRMPVLPTLQFMSNPSAFMKQSFERYGDPFLARLPAGLLAITRNPEGIKEIFTTDQTQLAAILQAGIEPALGPNSLMLTTGERHRRERKLLMPMFHGERMRSYGTSMQDIALGEIAKVRPGGIVEALPLAQSVSLQVIIRTVFGVEESDRMGRFVTRINEMVKAYGPLIAIVTAVRKPWFSPWARYKSLSEGFNDMLVDQIHRRRALDKQTEDILSLMLHTQYEDGSMMTEEEVRDELRTLLFTGHDTSSISMAWVLYWIHRFPEIKKKVEEELAPLGPKPSPEALVKLPYLNAVVDEAQRIRPVAALAARKLLSPFKLLGHELPAGMGVATSIVAAHANPEVFPEPDVFRPERFLEKKFTPWEYLPFGGGYKRCLGMAFALYQIKVVVGSLMAGHRFSLASSEEPTLVRRNVTMGPSTNIPLRYEGLKYNSAAAA
jgi:cytochrome P450 family 110